MVQWMEHLPPKCEGLSSDPQIPTKLGVVVHIEHSKDEVGNGGIGILET